MREMNTSTALVFSHLSPCVAEAIRMTIGTTPAVRTPPPREAPPRGLVGRRRRRPATWHTSPMANESKAPAPKRPSSPRRFFARIYGADEPASDAAAAPPVTTAPVALMVAPYLHRALEPSAFAAGFSAFCEYFCQNICLVNGTIREIKRIALLSHLSHQKQRSLCSSA